MIALDQDSHLQNKTLVITSTYGLTFLFSHVVVGGEYARLHLENMIPSQIANPFLSFHFMYTKENAMLGKNVQPNNPKLAPERLALACFHNDPSSSSIPFSLRKAYKLRIPRPTIRPDVVLGKPPFRIDPPSLIEIDPPILHNLLNLPLRVIVETGAGVAVQVASKVEG